MSDLLEREDERARIQHCIDQGLEGTGRLVVIEGPAGIGKTALVTEIREQAERSGVRVLRARGAELESDFAFGVVRQLFEPILAAAAPDERRELMQGPAARAASRLALPGAEPGTQAEDGVEASFAVLHGLYWLCADLAARAPLLVCVDDAHWADAGSLRFLGFLLPRLEELPLAVVVATRPAADRPAAEVLDALATDPLVETVHPRPLSDAALERVTDKVLGRRPDPMFLAAVQEASGGNPFLVESLLTGLRDEGVAPSEAGAQRIEQVGARSARRWILLRLAGLPRPAVRLAQALAVLESGTLELAGALAELDDEEAGSAAATLASASLLAPGHPLTFSHPMIRGGIYEEMGRALRSESHSRAAGLLADRGAPDEEVVKHLLAAEPAGRAEVVARLRSAAADAMRAGAPESAVSYLTRALREPPPQAERSGVLLELGVAADAAGSDEAIGYLEEALKAAEEPGPMVQAALVLNHALGRNNRIVEAVEVVDRTAGLLGQADDRLALQLEAAGLLHLMLGVERAASAVPRVEIALRRASEPSGIPRELLAVTALATVQSNAPAPEAAELARRALAEGRRPLPEPTDQPWFALAVGTLAWCECFEEAQTHLDAAVAESRRTSDVQLFSAALAYRSLLRVRRGDPLAAEADARTLLEADVPTPFVWILIATSGLVDALVLRGELDSADAAAAGLAAEAEFQFQIAAMLRSSRGRLRLAQHRPDEALADFTGVGEVAQATNAPCPAYLAWRSGASEALLALGESDEAGRLAEEELELARAFGPPRALGIALRTAGLARGDEAAEALLRESADTSSRAASPVEHGRSLLELGALLRRLNRRAEARPPLTEALELFRRTRAGLLAERAETELGAAGGRARSEVLGGVESLTPSERRVAELARDGLTNKEIAQSLFVTARTVEGHLSHVFRKLDVASRTELPDAMAAAA